MRLLITGPTGFIGRHLVDMALDDGHVVFGLTRAAPNDFSHLRLPAKNIIQHDLASKDEIDLGDNCFDAIIHLAFDTSANTESQEKIAIDGTKKICEIAKIAGIRKVILVSSMSVLNYSILPPGSAIDEESPILSNRFASGQYAYLKSKQESIFKEKFRDDGAKYCIIRPGLVYDDRYIIDAHGGLKLGPIKFQITHSGQVPVVEVRYLVRVLLEAANKNFSSGEIVHLLDQDLPSQAQYINGIDERNLLQFGSLKLSWRFVSWTVNLGSLLARFLYRFKSFPGALRPNEFAARFKPFLFDTGKVNTMFEARPTGKFGT